VSDEEAAIAREWVQTARRYNIRGADAFNRLMRLEQQATEIFLNQPLFVPGLLQVAGYATEVISRVAGLKSGDLGLADRVNVRVRRAEAFLERLRGTAPPHLRVVIDEAVLQRTVGGPGVMREQLDHLVAMSKLDTVDLAIIPLSYGAHVGLGGSFEVHEVAGGEAAVFFEGVTDEIVGNDSDLVQRCRMVAETLMAAAVSGAQARAVLFQGTSS
jgi:uncharacterized protein DUF5753